MEIKCDYKFSSTSVSNYTCNVESACIISPQTEIIAFKGKHVHSQQKRYVETIEFKNTIVHFIPKGIINTFPNVTVLVIENCGLKSISREDLKEFDALVEFRADENKLKSLPSNLFFDKLKLKKISFSSNELQYLSSLLLKPLLNNSLTYVNLLGNPSIDEWYYTGGYDKLKELMDVIDKQCSKPSEDNCGFTDKVFEKKLMSYTAELWTTGQFSDFTIIAGESSTKEDTVKNDIKEFRVHKHVLRLHSLVFTAMFENDLEESKSGKVKIVDFSASAVEQFLGFLYTGTVPDDVNAMELFALAAKYDVADLKKLSEKTILKNVGIANAIDIFNLGHLYSADYMKQEAFKSIERIFPGRSLDNALMNDPEGLKELIDADRIRKIETKEADDKLVAAKMTRSTEILKSMEKFNSVWTKINEKSLNSSQEPNQQEMTTDLISTS